MKGEPYRRITPTALARNATPQSGLRPASSTFYGRGALRTRAVHIFLLLSSIIPSLVSLTWANSTVASSFYYNYCNLVMFSIDFFFFTFFSKPVKKNPYSTKALLFYVLVSHANPKNSTGLSLSVEFFPSIPFLKWFLPLLWHLKTWLSLAFSGISPQAIQTLWKNICSRGGGVENRKGAEHRFFPGFRPLWGLFSAFFTGCNRFSTWFIHSCGNSCG